MADRSDIEETRDRMADTLDQIGDRLNPAHVTERIKEGVREATVGRVEDAARQAAHGVENVGRRFGRVVRDNPVPAAMVGIGLAWLIWSRRSTDDARDGGRSAVGEAAGHVADKTRDIAASLKEGTQAKAQRVESFFQRDPFIVGAAVLALGVVAGLALPESDLERRVMGPVRDTVADRAKEVVSDTKEKVANIAERTLDEAKTAAHDAAREEGLLR